jgi:hypothetical protein
MQALLDLAARYPDAVIPGYTHMRRAQAVLWPHYLLAYFEMFARDAERFGEARRRANVLPLGSGALAGSGFPFDREAMARDLGFDAHHRNSMDVSGDRDFALDFLYARLRDHAAPEPAGRRLDSVFQRRIRLAGTGRRRDQRLQPDAAEEESRIRSN